jgi:hypothetical protein
MRALCYLPTQGLSMVSTMQVLSERAPIRCSPAHWSYRWLRPCSPVLDADGAVPISRRFDLSR